MRNLILCLMFGLIVMVAGCGDDETNGDINNGGNGGPFDALRNITLDHVDGSPAAGKISAGANVVFYLRLKNTSGLKAKGIVNGFRIYSTDGATWGTTIGDTTGTLGKADFDGGMFINPFGISGTGVDTVGFGAFVITGTGLADGFNDVAYSVAIGPIDAPNVGKHVCIDSSFYPVGTWMWAFGTESHPPGWDGPHCFEVVQ